MTKKVAAIIGGYYCHNSDLFVSAFLLMYAEERIVTRVFQILQTRMVKLFHTTYFKFQPDQQMRTTMT